MMATGLFGDLQLYVNLLFCLAMGILPCLMARRLLPRRKGRAWELGPLLVFAVTFGMVTWVADENALILSPFFFAAFLVCYGGPVLARLVTAAIFYPMLISVNMLFDSAQYLWEDFPLRLTGEGWFIKALLWVLLLLLFRRLIPDGGPLRLSRRMWLLSGALSLAPMLVQLSFTLYNSHNLDLNMNVDMVYDAVLGYLSRMAYTVLPFVLLSTLALLFTLTRLAQYEQMAQERQLEEMHRAYYEQLEQRQAQVRRLRHDMVNHLQTLSALPQEERDAYLQELLDSPALRAPSKWSENRVVNAVLSAKAEDMAADHIRGDLSAPVPALLPFSDTDLCAVLANGLDNAIEACRKLPDPLRRLTLRARVDKGLFVLQVLNPCPEAPEERGGRFFTTKADAGRHGLGLESIRSIAEKYGGSMSAGLRGGDFELLLYLPLDGPTDR